MGASSDVAYLSRALKAPRIAALASPLAERARSEGWDYEHYLAQVLSEEVSSRESHGGDARVKAARFPQVKTLDDFDFSFGRSIERTQIAHLAQLDFLAEATNVVFLGPPGTGKTHLSIALGVQAARRGHRVSFATAHQWVGRLGAAKRAGRLDDELERLRRIPLLILDEVRYRIRWNDGHESLFAPAAGVARIEPARDRKKAGSEGTEPKKPPARASTPRKSAAAKAVREDHHDERVDR